MKPYPILYLLLCFALVSCLSKTQRLERNFSKAADTLRSDLLKKLTPDEQKRLLAPYVAEMGESQCQTIEVYVSNSPSDLRQDANDLAAPYKARITIDLTVMPLGRPIPDSGWPVVADEHLNWRMPPTDKIIWMAAFSAEEDIRRYRYDKSN